MVLSKFTTSAPKFGTTTRTFAMVMLVGLCMRDVEATTACTTFSKKKIKKSGKVVQNEHTGQITIIIPNTRGEGTPVDEITPGAPVPDPDALDKYNAKKLRKAEIARKKALELEEQAKQQASEQAKALTPLVEMEPTLPQLFKAKKKGIRNQTRWFKFVWEFPRLLLEWRDTKILRMQDVKLGVLLVKDIRVEDGKIFVIGDNLLKGKKQNHTYELTEIDDVAIKNINMYWPKMRAVLARNGILGAKVQREQNVYDGKVLAANKKEKLLAQQGRRERKREEQMVYLRRLASKPLTRLLAKIQRCQMS